MTVDTLVTSDAAAKKKPSRLPLSVSIATGIQVVLDIASLVMVGMLCWLVVLAGKNAETWGHYLAASLTIATLTAGAAHFSRLYRFEVVSRPKAHLFRLLTPLAAGFLLFVLLLFSFGHIDTTFSRIWTYLFFVAGEGAFLLERHGMARLIYSLARRGELARNVVIVGAGRPMECVAQLLATHDMPWVRVLGFFEDRAGRRHPVSDDCPILGTVAELATYSRTHRVDDIFIALPWEAEARLAQIFEQMREIPAHFHLIPEVSAHWLQKARFINYFGVKVLNVAEKPIDGWNYVVKWIEDKFIAVAMIVTLSPVLLLAIIAILLSSTGPILFCQNRLGFNNKAIRVYKFRTMYHEAQEDDAEIQATRNDPRVTPVGRFLRRYSIDELPQLINVLKGEMSLVGPRPHALKTKAAGRLYEDVVDNYADRHKIKPGITGLAQVNWCRGETNTEEKIKARVEFDLQYMENWSLLLDLKIMLRTIYVILSAKGAY